jgi:hypothetical protein
MSSHTECYDAHPSPKRFRPLERPGKTDPADLPKNSVEWKMKMKKILGRRNRLSANSGTFQRLSLQMSQQFQEKDSYPSFQEKDLPLQRKEEGFVYLAKGFLERIRDRKRWVTIQYWNENDGMVDFKKKYFGQLRRGQKKISIKLPIDGWDSSLFQLSIGGRENLATKPFACRQRTGMCSLENYMSLGIDQLLLFPSKASP